jgi:Cdc6-like AAA superfamily ATPase
MEILQQAAQKAKQSAKCASQAIERTIQDEQIINLEKSQDMIITNLRDEVKRLKTENKKLIVLLELLQNLVMKEE